MFRINEDSKQIGNRTLSEWSEIFISHMISVDDQFDSGHRIDHIKRVTQSAITLAEKIGTARLEIILPAVILHDALPMNKFDKRRSEASTKSADHAMELLSQWGYPAELLEDIHHVIVAHSFSANIPPQTLEAKIVQDADRLDALGPIGIIRAITVGAQQGNSFYNVQEPFPIHRSPNDKKYILDHFYLKLFHLPEKLYTQEAKREAEHLVLEMEYFLRNFSRQSGVEYVSYATYKQRKLMCAGTLGMTELALQEAIEVGYRYFDVATAYPGSHRLLANAIHATKINRSEFHICSKINDNDLLNNDFSVNNILQGILTELNTDYLDTLMLHSPALLMHEKAVAVFEELIVLKEKKLIHHIGVSNFTAVELSKLDSQYLQYIDYNQIEMSPYCQQSETVAFCNKHQIQLMAYRPFGKGKAEDLLQNDTLNEIAKKHQVSTHQVILAWAIYQNVVVVSKAGTVKHMQENLYACQIKLDQDDMHAIRRLDKDLHTCPWEQFVKLPRINDFKHFALMRPESYRTKIKDENTRVSHRLHTVIRHLT